MVHCYDAAASSFVTKVLGEVFTNLYMFALKYHSSMWN
jgi:hypothetical protein